MAWKIMDRQHERFSDRGWIALSDGNEHVRVDFSEKMRDGASDAEVDAQIKRRAVKMLKEVIRVLEADGS